MSLKSYFENFNIAEHERNVAAGKAKRHAPVTAGATIAPPAAVQRPEMPSEPLKTDFKASPSTDEAKLNKTERAYLAYLRRLGVPSLGIQNVTLKLADDCRLTVDFNYIDENGRWTFVDVKGFQREDALIKMKVAARLFPILRFVIVKKDGTGWDAKEVKP